MGSPHQSGRGKRPHLNTSSHLTKKTTMDSSVNTSSHPSRCGGGESYRWVTLPSIGTAVKGCHLVPMKVPLSMKEDDISIEEGGLTIRKVKEALPTVVKVVSLVNIDRKEPLGMVLKCTPGKKWQKKVCFGARCTAARWDTRIASLIPVRRLCTSSLKRWKLTMV